MRQEKIFLALQSFLVGRDATDEVPLERQYSTQDDPGFHKAGIDFESLPVVSLGAIGPSRLRVGQTRIEVGGL